MNNTTETNMEYFLVYDDGKGSTAMVFENGYVDFNDYDKQFESEAAAKQWLEDNGWDFSGVDKR